MVPGGKENKKCPNLNEQIRFKFLSIICFVTRGLLTWRKPQCSQARLSLVDSSRDDRVWSSLLISMTGISRLLPSWATGSAWASGRRYLGGTSFWPEAAARAWTFATGSEPTDSIASPLLPHPALPLPFKDPQCYRWRGMADSRIHPVTEKRRTYICLIVRTGTGPGQNPIGTRSKIICGFKLDLDPNY